jgi:hypothetical protein
VVGTLVRAIAPTVDAPDAAAANASMEANENGVAPGSFTGGVGEKTMLNP